MSTTATTCDNSRAVTPLVSGNHTGRGGLAPRMTPRPPAMNSVPAGVLRARPDPGSDRATRARTADAPSAVSVRLWLWRMSSTPSNSSISGTHGLLVGFGLHPKPSFAFCRRYSSTRPEGASGRHHGLPEGRRLAFRSCANRSRSTAVIDLDRSIVRSTVHHMGTATRRTTPISRVTQL